MYIYIRKFVFIKTYSSVIIRNKNVVGLAKLWIRMVNKKAIREQSIKLYRNQRGNTGKGLRLFPLQLLFVLFQFCYPSPFYQVDRYIVTKLLYILPETGIRLFQIGQYEMNIQFINIITHKYPCYSVFVNIPKC